MDGGLVDLVAAQLVAVAVAMAAGRGEHPLPDPPHAARTTVFASIIPRGRCRRTMNVATPDVDPCGACGNGELGSATWCGHEWEARTSRVLALGSQEMPDAEVLARDMWLRFERGET